MNLESVSGSRRGRSGHDDVERLFGARGIRDDLGDSTVERDEHSAPYDGKSQQVRVRHLCVANFFRATWLDETTDTSSAQNSWPGSATILPSSWIASMGERACGTSLALEDTLAKPLCVTGHVAHHCLARCRLANQTCAAS